MFHSSTTLHHHGKSTQQKGQSSRQVFFITGMIKDVWNGGVWAKDHVKNKTKYVLDSRPFKVAFPAHYIGGKVWDGTKWTADKAVFGAQVGYEAGKGFYGLDNSVARAGFELGSAPFKAGYIDLIGKNTRDTAKFVLKTAGGAAKLPFKIAAAPKKGVEKLWGGIGKIRSGIYKVLTEPGQVLNDMAEKAYNTITSPLEVVKGVRDKISKTFSAVGGWFTKAFEYPIQVGSNFKDAGMRYIDAPGIALEKLKAVPGRFTGAYTVVDNKRQEALKAMATLPTPTPAAPASNAST